MEQKAMQRCFISSIAFWLSLVGFALSAYGWSKPVPVPGLATTYHEFTPWITPDGSTLYFIADYPWGFGGNDIYYRNRQTDGSWGPIINLGPPVNSPADERAPCLSPDGTVLIFTSYKRPNQPGDTSIYCSMLLPNGGWSEPKLFDGINSKFGEFTAYPARDGSRIWFTSYRPGGVGEEDIWCLPRAVGGWGKPYYLKPPLNTSRPERTEGVVAGGKKLFFCSERPEGMGDMDIYYARLNEDCTSGVVYWLPGGANSFTREYSTAFDSTSGVLYFCRMQLFMRTHGMDMYMTRSSLPYGEDGPPILVTIFNSFQHY